MSLLIVAALPAAGACTKSTNAGGGTAAVSIRLVAYHPEGLRVPAGTSVTWTQRDPGFHTVTSGTAVVDATGAAAMHPDGVFDSGNLATGGRFSFTFPSPGTYRYFCRVHPATMHGSITVS